eukprot:TRINITY_DN1681_c1_g1_i11.p5 TRINITY_DN1681_c1_g1~~TRINITY_DN1681_c1_g1_i11.p5  ORF type:complete len:230 (-),score=34.32 TRINITY_DN1681_c1_g1_i11:1443-2132(-)
MASWIFGQKPREPQRETVDKEFYDKALDENIRLKEQLKKVTVNSEDRKSKLNGIEKRFKELQIQLEEDSTLLGILANDTGRNKDKYTGILISTAKEILSLEQKLKLLEDKNKKLTAKVAQPKVSKGKEIANRQSTIKEIEGEYLISSLPSAQRASMSGKEEAAEKQKALVEELEEIDKRLEVMRAMSHQGSGWGEDIEIQQQRYCSQTCFISYIMDIYIYIQQCLLIII